ncbi:hypothetical protein Tco_1171236 [Tanacetum coccineum]
MTGLPKDFTFKALSLEDVDENTMSSGIYNAVDQVMRPLALKKLKNPEVIMECQKPISPFHHHWVIILDPLLIIMKMMKMKVLLVQVLHPFLPTSTPFIHSITKDTTFPPPLNKMMIFSSSDKLPCLIKCSKSMKKLEVDSNHSARHCQEFSERKRNEDVE